MSAWGKTGRVVLAQYTDTDGETWPDFDVYADGEGVGRAYRHTRNSRWATSTGPNLGPLLPSLDAAVMWVLRRAAPDVWREERGPVVRVEPMWPLAAFSGLTGLARPRRAATRWVVDAPDGRPAETFQSWPDAMKAATS